MENFGEPLDHTPISQLNNEFHKEIVSPLRQHPAAKQEQPSEKPSTLTDDIVDYARQNPATSTVLGGLGLIGMLAITRGRSSEVARVPFGSDFLKVTFKEAPQGLDKALFPEAKIDKILFPDGKVAKNLAKSWYAEPQWREYTPWWKTLGPGQAAVKHNDQYKLAANGLERISPLHITEWNHSGVVSTYENTRMFSSHSVSPSFAGKIYSLFKKIPEDLRSDLVRNRLHYHMDSNVFEQNPHIARTIDREVEGIVFGGNNVHMGEYIVENGMRRKVPDATIAYVFNHETGHTLNNVYDLINHPTLRGAYIKDIRNNIAPSNNYSDLEYFLQTPKGSTSLGSDKGLDELLADSFSITSGTGAFYQYRLASAFPTVLREYPGVLNSLGKSQF